MLIQDISDFLQTNFYPVYDDNSQFCGNARDGKIIIWYINQFDENVDVTIEVCGIVETNGRLIVSTFEEFVNFYNHQIQLYGIGEDVYDEAMELAETMENLDLNSRDYGLFRFSAG